MTEVAKESAIAALMSGLTFWQLAILVVVLFTSHNYMQELLMSFPCFGSVRITLVLFSLIVLLVGHFAWIFRNTWCYSFLLCRVINVK